MKPQITAETQIAVLTQLAAGHKLKTVAAGTRLTRIDVLEIALGHGYPDRDKLAEAANSLRAEVESLERLRHWSPTHGH